MFQIFFSVKDSKKLLGYYYFINSVIFFCLFSVKNPEKVI